jgi:hypothetical protein
MVQNFEVILEQVLNHSVELCYFFALPYLYKLFNFLLLYLVVGLTMA